MHRLRADIQAGRVNVVIATDLSRISRSAGDFVHFFKFANEHGAEVVCLKQDLDSTALAGKLMTTAIMALAEFERDQICERNRDATLTRAQRGLWNGGHLLGYDLPEGKKGSLVVNERQAEVVRLAFSIYEKTGSILETFKELNVRGFRTESYTSRRDKHHASGPFGYTKTRWLLQNKAYLALREIWKKNKRKNPELLPETQRYREVSAIWAPSSTARRSTACSASSRRTRSPPGTSPRKCGMSMCSTAGCSTVAGARGRWRGGQERRD